MIAETIFKQDYEQHLHHLKLKGLQSKTIDAYSRSVRYIGKYFGYEIRNLSEQQLTDYFVARIGTRSWSAVKLDLYGLKGKPKQAWFTVYRCLGKSNLKSKDDVEDENCEIF